MGYVRHYDLIRAGSPKTCAVCGGPIRVGERFVIHKLISDTYPFQVKKFKYTHKDRECLFRLDFPF